MYYLIYSYILFNLFQWTSGDLHPQVFGGGEFRQHVHKHLVHLVLFRHDQVQYECSGSILSNRWIISAAHCFEDNIKQVVVLKLGNKGETKIANGHEHIVFPNFNMRYGLIPDEMVGLDLALLKTTENILFDDNTQPIRLAETRPKLGQIVIVAGYGASEHGSSAPREGSAPLEKCPGKLLCTHSTMRTGPGDSGGPLVSKGRLIGITSSGSCDDGELYLPYRLCVSYYVDVTQHLNWIKNVTGLIFETIKY